MLVKTELFKEISPPWFEQLDTYDKENNRPGFFPEDFLLCEKAKGKGYKIIVDTQIKTKHFGNYTYSL